MVLFFTFHYTSIFFQNQVCGAPGSTTNLQSPFLWHPELLVLTSSSINTTLCKYYRKELVILAHGVIYGYS